MAFVLKKSRQLSRNLLEHEDLAWGVFVREHGRWQAIGQFEESGIFREGKIEAWGSKTAFSSS